MATVTISTHNGSEVATAHNLRVRAVTDKESHIRADGQHETWRHEDVRSAYARLFGSAVEDYNARQKRDDRKIADYYRDICKSKQKHPVYEMIAQVGSKDNRPNDALCKIILKRYVSDWKRRNPNLEMIGAYYHADEDGVPHVHIDYVPVAYGYKRGPAVQTGLDRALTQQGCIGSRKKETAQIVWERSENAALEKLCVSYGLTVEHPQRGKGVEHLSVAAYKAQKRVDGLQSDVSSLATEKAVLDGSVRSLKHQARSAEQDRDMARSEAVQARSEAEAVQAEADRRLDSVTALAAALTDKQEQLEKWTERYDQAVYDVALDWSDGNAKTASAFMDAVADRFRGDALVGDDEPEI